MIVIVALRNVIFSISQINTLHSQMNIAQRLVIPLPVEEEKHPHADWNEITFLPETQADGGGCVPRD